MEQQRMLTFTNRRRLWLFHGCFYFNTVNSIVCRIKPKWTEKNLLASSSWYHILMIWPNSINATIFESSHHLFFCAVVVVAFLSVIWRIKRPRCDFHCHWHCDQYTNSMIKPLNAICVIWISMFMKTYINYVVNCLLSERWQSVWEKSHNPMRNKLPSAQIIYESLLLFD